MIYYEGYYGVTIMDLDPIVHHGIKGQKWGVRNGPPYPLGSAAHNKVVKKARTDKGRRPAKSDNNFAVSGKAGVPEPQLKDNRYDHSKSAYTHLGKQVLMTTIRAIRFGPAAPAVVLPMVAQTVANAAIASIKEKKAAKRSEKAELDTKTGFKKKSKEWTAEQDLKAVNPGFKNFDDNTKHNCMLCTMTYDLRRRGYEVTANKASYGFYTGEITRWYPKAKVESASGIGKNGKWNSKIAIENTKKALIAQGDGARGSVNVTWTKGAGHAMAYEVKNGNVKIYDAQPGKVYSMERYLRHTSRINYVRLDNVEPDWKKMKEVAR